LYQEVKERWQKTKRNKKEQTKRIEKETKYNWGYNDAKIDRLMGFKNRSLIKDGLLFCLPKNEKEYCMGYDKGFNE